MRGARRLLFTAVLATALVGSGTLGVRAFTPAQWQHYFTCFHLMVFDPPRHREECLPYNGGPHQPSVLSGPNDNYPPVVVVVPQAIVPTTTVVVPDPDPTPTTTIVVDECTPPQGGAQAAACEIAR